MRPPVKDSLTRLHGLIADAVDAPPGGPRLLLLNQARGELDSAMRAEALHMQRRHATWADIGRLLGITRQSAWERFGRPRT